MWAIVALACAIGAPRIEVVRAGQQGGASAKELYQQALHEEDALGNLEAAIKLYQRIVKEFASDRALAAKALVQMGRAYEKFGNAEARNMYDRVLRDYADQRDMVAQARARLAALSPPAGATTASRMAIRRLWAGDVNNLNGAPSPDGRYFSYRDLVTRDLSIHDLGTGATHRLTTGRWADNVGPSTFSPDGQQIAYEWLNRTDGGVHELRLIRVAARPEGALIGFQPRLLYRNPEKVDIIWPHEWSPDGKYILAGFRQTDTTHQIVLVSAADGSARVLKTLRRLVLKMSFSPDGRYIAYDFPPQEGSPARDIFVLATDGSREVPLVEHPADDRLLGWARDGHILFSSDRTGTKDAWVIPVVEGNPRGSATRVRQDLGQFLPMGLTRNGSFYYGLETGRLDLYVTTLDLETGKVLVPATRATERVTNISQEPSWSLDGRYLAYLAEGGPLPGGELQDGRLRIGRRLIIVIRSLETGEERELSPKVSLDRELLQWSPDGKHFLVTGYDDRGRRRGLFQVDAKTGDVTPIAQASSRDLPATGCWSADGKAIFYARNDLQLEPRISRLLVRDLETGQERELYRAVSPPAVMTTLRLSPDGRWIAFNMVELTGGRPRIMIMPAGGGEARELPTPRQGRPILTGWTPDSRHLLFTLSSSYYFDEHRELWRVGVNGEAPQKLDLSVKAMSSDHAVHPDGRRMAFSTFWPKGEVWTMENFLPPLGASR